MALSIVLLCVCVMPKRKVVKSVSSDVPSRILISLNVRWQCAALILDEYYQTTS